MPGATDFGFSTSKFAADEVKVLRFTGSEGISQCFAYDLELVSFEIDVGWEDVIGEPGVLEIHTMHGQRYVHGIVARWEEVGYDRAFTYYSVRLVPRLWTLTLNRQSRIFQGMTTPEILKKVLEGADIPANMFRFSLSGNYEPRGYCVQYRETDFDFISRLMEEEGIFFFFEHTEDGHVLVIGDTPDVHVELPEDSLLRFREGEAGMLSEETVHHFRYSRTLRTGAVVLKEFDFKKPSLALKAEKADGSNKESKFRSYDYPGEYHVQALGDRLAKVRLEEERAESYLGVGETDCRRFEAGWKFTMEEHPRDELNTNYVITRVRHTGEQPHAGGGGGGAGGDQPKVYRGYFECIPLEIPYRPPRYTPRPRIDGPQTAVVVGPAGEEIHCDDLGRVKVKFHWDRSDAKDENASCWIRVSQAGSGYGSMFIPRIGSEVIVEFLEGDPDRPLITGRVFNAAYPPPYALPDHKSVGTFKSSSTPGGEGASELRFEDKKGKEQILLQAEKDMDTYIKNDDRTWIGRDTHLDVVRDRYEKIERDEHILIERDSLNAITRDHSLMVDGKQMIEVAKTHTFQVGGDVHETMKGEVSQEVGKNLYIKVKQKIVIEAGTQITLKVGGNFLVLDPSGVTLVGTLMKLNSGGSAGTLKPVKAVPAVKPKEANLAGSSTAPAYSASSGKGGEKIAPIDDTRPSHKEPKKDQPPSKDKTWVEFELLDADKNPVAGEPYEAELPGGKITSGITDADGLVRIEGVDPGSAKIRFPRLDKSSWKPA